MMNKSIVSSFLRYNNTIIRAPRARVTTVYEIYDVCVMECIQKII